MRLLQRSVAGGCVVVAITYVACALITASPLSAANYRFRSAASRVATYNFQQNWTLFAPQPPQANYPIVAQARCLDASGERTTPYYNVAGYLNQLRRVNLVGSTRLNRVLDQASWLLPARNGTYVRLQNRRHFDRRITQAKVAKAAARESELAQLMIGRALSGGRKLFCGSHHLVAVRWSLLRSPVRPFATRSLKTPPPVDEVLYKSGWVSAAHVESWW